MKKSIRRLVKPRLFAMSISLLAFSSITYGESNGSFALSEHWSMGQQIKLRFDINEVPQSGVVLHLKNGLALTAGDIISLGDLYGIVGKPISHGLTKLEKQTRFKEVFNSFARNAIAVSEVEDLNSVIRAEMREVESGIAKGETAEAIYKRIGNEVGRQINCITGGGCNSLTWWLNPGRYLKLAMENYDHFTPNNLIAYKSGHHVALQQALKAKRTGNRSDLEIAYAMDAFACHYLSDHFAAGHLRTPREELSAIITPTVLGALLSNYMHNEENKYGIHVTNNLGEQWMVYGDYSYFNPFNQTNQQMLLKALQASADEIFEAYYSGVLPEKNQIEDMIPHITKLNDENNMDIAPMFYWDKENKQLLRRTNLTNPYDRHWTNSWWGWSTLLLLKTQYGITSTVQLSLSKYLSQYVPEELQDNPLV
ncbi:TPA: phospholipase [Legionella pneumophila]|nr:phospholipase [Legionella pneumophila]HAU1182168.1 phospholipase [Legionella pneumophila]